MTAESAQFIEVMRIISEDNSPVKSHSSPEMLPVDIIGPFRGWKKGENDVKIKGEMTLIVLKDFARNENGEVLEDRRPRKILIEESYESFKSRLSTKIVTRTL